MTEPEPKWLLKAWKNRKLVQAQQEIELLRLEIEKAKLEKQLKEIRNDKTN
jgi:hypothetical protein